MTENNTRLSRRTVIRTGAVGVTVGAVGAGAVLYGSQPALAVNTNNFTADDVDVLADPDGEVHSVTIEPDVTVQYENFAASGAEATVTVTASDEDDGETSVSNTTTFDDTDDSENITLDETELSEDLEFEAGEETMVMLEVTVTVDAEEDDNLSEGLDASTDTQFTVDVTEHGVVTDIDGSAQTDHSNTSSD